jgi:hypothetical protein
MFLKFSISKKYSLAILKYVINASRNIMRGAVWGIERVFDSLFPARTTGAFEVLILSHSPN